MTPSHKHLLIVDDDAPLLEALTARFACYGFAVEGASTPAMMRTRLAQAEWALVVLEPLVQAQPGHG